MRLGSASAHEPMEAENKEGIEVTLWSTRGNYKAHSLIDIEDAEQLKIMLGKQITRAKRERRRKAQGET